jgi:hypothetical protein
VKPEEVDEDVIRVLARVAGIRIPKEDLAPLIAAFKNHVTGMAELDSLDLEEHDPVVIFDASWGARTL